MFLFRKVPGRDGFYCLGQTLQLTKKKCLMSKCKKLQFAQTRLLYLQFRILFVFGCCQVATGSGSYRSKQLQPTGSGSNNLQGQAATVYRVRQQHSTGSGINSLQGQVATAYWVRQQQPTGSGSYSLLGKVATVYRVRQLQPTGSGSYSLQGQVATAYNWVSLLTDARISASFY